jgi:hypothetical protein
MNSTLSVGNIGGTHDRIADHLVSAGYLLMIGSALLGVIYARSIGTKRRNQPADAAEERGLDVEELAIEKRSAEDEP